MTTTATQTGAGLLTLYAVKDNSGNVLIFKDREQTNHACTFGVWRSDPSDPAQPLDHVQLLQMEVGMDSLNPQQPADAPKLAAFFALLDQRQREHEERQAQERKDREDKKLARLNPWWMESAQ